MKWNATHKITFRHASGIASVDLVMLVSDPDPEFGGPAYTRDEWDAEAGADWHWNANDGWTFQGKPAASAAPNGSVTVTEV